MKYKLQFGRQFDKDFAKLDPMIQSRILTVIESFQSDPYQSITKLRDMEKGQFRRRIGDYRIRFDIYENEKVIYLYRVRHRKDIYKS